MKHWNHALITGAGSGLGHGLAIRLLNRGTPVSILDLTINDERRIELDEAAKKGGAKWQFVQGNVIDEDAMHQAIAHIVDIFGAPDLAIHSAGVGLSQSFEKMPSEAFRRVIEINLMGSYYFAAAVLAVMKPGSRLALMASLAGITSNYGYSAYGTSKFGVVGLATTLRYEYEPRGIHISCICPPEVKTPLVALERANGDPITHDLKIIAGSMNAGPACDQILAGLDAGQWQIIPSLAGKFTAFAAQKLPSVFYRITNLLIRKYMRKHGHKVID